MIPFHMPQYSPEWWAIRRGVPTASAFDQILTSAGKLSRSAIHYAESLVADRLHPHAEYYREGFQSFAMKRGRTLEPLARSWYAGERGIAEPVGFCTTDDGRFGCSPDALVGAEGVLELKCPLWETHQAYLRAGVLPAKYRAQCHGHLLVTGRKWCDFVSFYPGQQSLIVRVRPDEYTHWLWTALNEFDRLYRNLLGERAPDLTPAAELARRQPPPPLFADDGPIPLDWEERLVKEVARLAY
jgi:hypothetical protein